MWKRATDLFWPRSVIGESACFEGNKTLHRNAARSRGCSAISRRANNYAPGRGEAWALLMLAGQAGTGPTERMVPNVSILCDPLTDVLVRAWIGAVRKMHP